MNARSAVPVPHAGPPAPKPYFFPVSWIKFVVLSLCTFGLYEIVWFYRNWKLENARKPKGVPAILMAIFAPLFSYALFRRIAERGKDVKLPATFSPGLLALAFFLLSVSWRLPGPYDLISLLTFVPLLPVRAAITAINAERTPRADRNRRFSLVNIIVTVPVGAFLALAGIGFFLTHLSRPNPKEALSIYAWAQNRDLSKTVGEIEAVSVMAEEGVLIHRYRFPSRTSLEINVPAVRDAVRSEVLPGACADEDMSRMMRKNVAFEYIYSDRQGVEVLRFTIAEKDCFKPKRAP